MGLIVEENQGGHFDRYPRGLAYSNITNTCEVPNWTVTIDHHGDCYLCKCAGWLPKSVGNISSMTSLEEVWNNHDAKLLQQDVEDQKFTICAVKHCGILDGNIQPLKFLRHKKADWISVNNPSGRRPVEFLHQPNPFYTTCYEINLAIDESCNLACPSCRSSMINFIDGPIYQERLARANHFLTLLDKFEKPFRITMIGSGDPLASLITRPIVLNWKPKENQQVILFTNGLLMKKLLPGTAILPKIVTFWISVDAGSKEVYENVRRPGKYEVLRENLDWLAKNKSRHAEVKLKFTLSASNATDIINFCDMCNYYNFIGEITNVCDWRSWNNFQEHEVFLNTTHPLHTTAIEQLHEASTRSYIKLGPEFSKLT